MSMSEKESIRREVNGVYDLCAETILLFCGAATQRRSWPPHLRGFLDHTQRRTIVGRTPLDD
jgi:hypothetical protein